MNAYDFDGTIYAGDSTLRFYLYCLTRYPRIARRWPALWAAGARLVMGKATVTAVKQQLFLFLRDIPDVDAAVNAFWAADESRIKKWYRNQRRDDDLIISASPEFLLRPIVSRLGLKKLIATRVDPKTGAFQGPNCSGAEKAIRYHAVYGDLPIARFYSDTRSDAPMARLAAEAFRVKGERVRGWGEVF